MTSARSGSTNSLSTGTKAGIWVLAVALVAVVGLVAYLALNRTPADPTPQPSPSISPTPAATTPSPSSDPEPTVEPTNEPAEPEPTEPVPVTEEEPTPAPAQTLMWQGLATFEHFTVELQEDSGDGPEVPEGKAVLPVEVCLVKALDDGDTARISLDPWSLEDSSGSVQRPQVPGSYEPAFPTEGTYSVGECASGYLTFDLVTDSVDWVNLVYSNGLGDRAVWQFH